MDTFLAIASRREVRDYAPTPISGDVRTRILDAGRLAGSSRNTQLWEFVVPAPETQAKLAETVWAPENVASAAFVVAIVGEAFPFDVGRCAQNMLLAAWNEGVGSCPNGLRDPEAAAELLGGGRVNTILSFGYPAQERRDPQSRTAEQWSGRANRKPLDELSREA